jgi:elongation factor Ts
MQVAASGPRWVRREDVPADALEKEREILMSQAESSGKPKNVVEKIVEGKLSKFYGETVLLEQPFIKNDKQTVKDYLTERIAVLKENIQVRRFTRYERGEAV